MDMGSDAAAGFVVPCSLYLATVFSADSTLSAPSKLV